MLHKKLFIPTLSLAAAMLLCSCGKSGEIIASVNGVDIKKSDYELHLKNNEIMRELLTEDLKTAEISEEEKAAQLKRINDYCTTDEDAILHSMIETAYINSKYNAISHEDAKIEMERQFANLDTYSEDYSQTAAVGRIMDEYLKQSGLTKDEYIDIAAESYASFVNKQKAKEKFANGKECSDDELEKQFDSFLKQEIDKAAVIY